MALERYETPKTLCLDCSIFEPGKELFLSRLVPSDRTQLDGMGSAKRPGSWNRAGQPTVYTALEVNTAVAEVLHWVDDDLIPSDYVVMTIRLRIPHRIKLLTSSRKFPRRASPEEKEAVQMLVYESIELATFAFENPSRDEDPFAIAVPSKRAASWNVVLYPEAPGFWDHVALTKVEPFRHNPDFYL